MAHDDSKDFASKGVAGSALGLGIAGTALALLNNNGDGIANLFGNRNNHNHCNTPFVAPAAGMYGYPGTAAFETGYVIQNERRIGCLEAELTGLKVGQVKDARIALLEDQLVQSNMLRYVDDKTCGVVRGQNLLNPNQIADPYMGQRMVIATHPPFGPGYPTPFNNNCGCKDFDRWY